MIDETLAELLASALVNTPPGETTNTYEMFGIK